MIDEAAWLRFTGRLKEDLATHHAVAPEAIGLPLSALRSQAGYAAAGVGDLIELAVHEGHVVRRDGIIGLPGHRPRLRASEHPVADRVLRETSSQRPGESMNVRDILPTTIDFLERSGAIVRIDDHRIMSADQFEHVALWMIDTSRSQPLELPTVRDQLGIGRDTVQRLMERLDRMGLTVRHGEGRRPGPSVDEWLSSRTDRHARRTAFLREPLTGVSSQSEPGGTP